MRNGRKRHPYTAEKQRKHIELLRELVPSMDRTLAAEEYYHVVLVAEQGDLYEEVPEEYVSEFARGITYTQAYNDAVRLAGNVADLLLFNGNRDRGRLCKDGPLSGTLAYLNTQGRWVFGVSIEEIARIREVVREYEG